jgi:hypothetical protein
VTRICPGAELKPKEIRKTEDAWGGLCHVEPSVTVDPKKTYLMGLGNESFAVPLPQALRRPRATGAAEVCGGAAQTH